MLAEDLNPDHPAYSATAAPYKPLLITDKNARDAEACARVATLALGLRAANARSVTGSVDGFVSMTGRVYNVNTVAWVVVEADGIDEDMWVSEVVRTLDRNGGQKTRLTLLPLGALVLGEMPA